MVDSASRRATGSGRAIARFFGNSSPKSIWTKVENSDGEDGADADPDRGRDADAAEQLTEAAPDQGFGDIADEQAGDGDAQLGAGEHERGAASDAEGAGGARVSRLGPGFEPRAVDRHVREFLGDEVAGQGGDQ